MFSYDLQWQRSFLAAAEIIHKKSKQDYVYHLSPKLFANLIQYLIPNDPDMDAPDISVEQLVNFLILLHNAENP